MPKILFVCTANICRSPMAAGLFQALLAQRSGDSLEGEWQVESAGTWASRGLPAARGAAEAMAQRGIDLADHRSKPVAEEDLRNVDLVLTMTAGQREGIVVEFPFAANRVHLLTEMSGRSYDVPDPYGGSQAQYDACAEELEQLIEAGAALIVALANKNAR
jgi:protein-tyrosine phosphatase